MSDASELRPAIGEPMQPVELRSTFPMALQDGLYSTTTDVWKMLVATRAGNLAAVKAMVEQTPGLARCEHNYMPPLQLAVREGHVEVVEYLLQCGAYDPKFVTYPYKETIHTLADDRNFGEIGKLLERFQFAERARVQGKHEAGHIDYSADPTQANREQLEKLVNADALGEVEKFAEARPSLLQDPLLFWAEGVVSVPCRGQRTEMIELLLRLGARVPEIAKWAAYYYFKHSDVAERLLEAGMNPAHMNWHRTTLLHHVAWEGDLPKATLLVKHGADVNALDDEFRSTPLGMAARAGHPEIAVLLLENGADPRRAGAAWAMPMAWAQKKGHATVLEVLKSASA